MVCIVSRHASLGVHLFFLTGHCLYCFTTYLTGSSSMGVICIASLHALPVLPYWTWLVLFHYMLSWVFLTGHGLHCFSSSITGSFLLGIVCIVWHPSLVHHYWAWLVSSSLSMVCIVSLHASLVLPCLLWLAFFHLMIHWFIIGGWCVIDFSLLGMACIVSIHHWFIIIMHALYSFISCFTSSSLLEMVCIVSLRALPVLPYWAWLVLFHFIHPWFVITGHRSYCSTSSLTGWSLLCMVCIVSLPPLVHHYLVWYVLFHFSWFVLFHVMLLWFVLFHFFLCMFFLTEHG